ncbi:glycosyltransferase family 4 protein [Baudoinia panamericana UAMH 10762]|uniref:Phosphatidylinositol N-acetylglucosaminyltransferase GPI3 subunit n=1 Tax=Baudoinia panamericana (strain UAMH 10762) TaxID=717646 RepID=M2LDL0_BAUPA|nr:glycosyltransferase family 4 protein [Baudoinia panamericana UAMH 10762]EMC92067.1 glycosyltransferase family 4 protein [Baudoinia panamericana UAMH 10762]
MISDFFYPQPGGVESHIYQLSTKLIDRGHRVIIITHAYSAPHPSRSGVRYLTNRLKVYHLPHWVVYRSTTFPTVFSSFPILRQIFIREQIQIVHGHASLSNLCHEGLLHARTMGLATVFTDHSLFGFSDAASIMANKLLKFSLSDVGHVICVSHTCKENTTLRASLNPLAVSVIPNAVVASNFRPLQPHEAKLLTQGGKGALLPPPPDPSQPVGPNDPITIIVISRLFYNKGTDLLISALPLLLRRHENLRFIIAGSGPKAIDLEQTLDSLPQQLVYTASGSPRVVLLGSIRHEEVRDVMVRGHLLLSTSLTEAFGTVLVEAASCGLMVVATRVGGVPEVLPGNMTIFVLPEVEDVVRGVTEAVGLLISKAVRRDKFHDLVKNMYSWSDIARRTERVYDLITGCPSAPDNIANYDEEWQHYGQMAHTQSQALIDRLKRYFGCGVWAGKLFVVVVVVDYLIYCVLELIYPREGIDVCKPWPVMGADDGTFGIEEVVLERFGTVRQKTRR